MISPETPPDLPPDDPTEEAPNRLSAFQSWMEHHFKINARLQAIETGIADLRRDVVAGIADLRQELATLRGELSEYRKAQDREAAAAEATQAAQERAADQAAKQRQEATEARALRAEEERANALAEQARAEERFAKFKSIGGWIAGVLGFGAAAVQAILSLLRGGQ